MTEDRQNRIQSFAFVISIFIAIGLSFGFTSNLISSGQSYNIELDRKINPNYAPVASLIRLPNIGIARAEAIVAYRRDFSKQNNSITAFRSYRDLQKVKGIGPQIAENISQWLKFE